MKLASGIVLGLAVALLAAVALTPVPAKGNKVVPASASPRRLCLDRDGLERNARND
jgi:hypothetical protein